ncbi:MAG: hypothetical protein E6767_11120 [Dysgonomonas sp.]|nr:hypothetical protein [Dysgonomonas sp.]
MKDKLIYLIKQQRNLTKRLLQCILLFPLFIFLIAISSCKNEELTDASTVILLINSNVQEKSIAEKKVIPYFNHFGIKYKTVDIAKGEFPLEDDPALVVIGHSEIVNRNNDLFIQLNDYLERCLLNETGVLSFDPRMPKNLLSEPIEDNNMDSIVGALRYSDEVHYITGYHKPGETKELLGYMSIPKTSVEEGRAIITGNGNPLLVVNEQGKGRIAQWSSQDWMFYSVLGPLGGLDDCLWRSIVWTARKPFVMQALPPLVTMRVDDAMGAGRQQWDVSPFQWVKTANEYGFKPWLGLFIYNITPEGINELKELLPTGLATASPHAFGRPPRPESFKKNIEAYYKEQLADTYFVPDYWYPNAIPYLSDYYDEFIFFDHNNQKPWTPETSKKILKAVDDWYGEAGLPMGEYLIPHWGEINADMMAHIQDNWGIDFVAVREVDKSWGQQTPEYNLKEGKQPVRTAPFRLYDEPIVGKKKENMTTSRAAYNACFRKLADREFFDFSSSINDITGYEWQPDNNVEATAKRGVQILSRGLEAKALAVLFTHETDFIYTIKPENWASILKKVNEELTGYNPVYITTDDGVKILRAFNTSEIRNCEYSSNSGKLTLKMSGKTDVPTSVYVYTDNEDGITERLLEIPTFQNEVFQVLQLSE